MCVRWTVSTTFKHLGRGQSVSSTFKKKCAVDSQHFIQTIGPRTVSSTLKKGVRWTFSTTLKQLHRGQFFGRALVILTGVHTCPLTITLQLEEGR